MQLVSLRREDALSAQARGLYNMTLHRYVTPARAVGSTCRPSLHCPGTGGGCECVCCRGGHLSVSAVLALLACPTNCTDRLALRARSLASEPALVRSEAGGRGVMPPPQAHPAGAVALARSGQGDALLQLRCLSRRLRSQECWAGSCGAHAQATGRWLAVGRVRSGCTPLLARENCGHARPVSLYTKTRWGGAWGACTCGRLSSRAFQCLW